MEPHRLALPAGFQIEHYRIEAVLGKGGFGITYLAVDLQLGKRVAIKELLPDTIATRVEGFTVVPHSASLKENWEWARDRFLEEARTLAAFSHPAIVGVHRLIEANGTVYMVMDYVEGESYEARLQRIGTESDEISLMQFFRPILDGLEEVHGKGVLHRDIKPENILINKRGHAVLVDFGSAREAIGKTVTMTSIVTHGYSPLEQYQSKGKMGPWTDIYSTSAVMYRAITGNKPPVAVERIEKDEYQHLSAGTWGAGFSPQLRKAIDRGLAVKASERPQSINAWSINAASIPASTSERHALEKPDHFRTRWLLAAAGAILCALLAFAFGMVSGESKSRKALIETELRFDEAEKRLKEEADVLRRESAEALDAAKKVESDALARVRYLEDERSSHNDKIAQDRQELEKSNTALQSEVALLQAQVAQLEKDAAEEKAAAEKREQARLRAQQEREAAAERNRASTTVDEALTMNRSALAAAGRAGLEFSTSIAPEVVRLGQPAQIIIRIQDRTGFNAKGSPPRQVDGVRFTDPSKYDYDTRSESDWIGARMIDTKTLAYTVIADRPGVFLIPSFNVDVDGILLRTYPVQLEVRP